MLDKNGERKNVIVTGDVIMDWNLARIHDGFTKDPTWNPASATNISWQPGGAALLGNLVVELVGNLEAEIGKQISIFQPKVPVSAVDPDILKFHQSYSIWSRFRDDNSYVWRVEEFLGLDRYSTSAKKTEDWGHIEGELESVDLVIIDDADMGFRNSPEYWEISLRDLNKSSWIVLKMSQPIGTGDLFKRLLKNYSDRLIVLTTVEDLRLTEVQISKGLSWERTAQDFVWELKYNPQINALAQAACIVVSFGAAGAVICKRQIDSNSIENLLVFDPAVIEGEWISRHPGGMIGYTTCLAAGIARHILLTNEIKTIESAVQSGLAAIRDLHLGGYKNNGTDEDPHIIFPLTRIASALSNSTDEFTVVEIEDPVKFLTVDVKENSHLPKDGYWSILQNRYLGNLSKVSEQIVVQGADRSLDNVPQGIFGGLFTVDRQEIESFRGIAALTGEYLCTVRPKKPLSIGVFGAPGSGKSFGITQVAEMLAPDRIEVLEFNLSQFRSTQELTSALHQVRDVNLSGLVPLVFWDEFDSTLEGNPFGWLKYFLSPMQDGSFREGQIVHPIGPAIFVFAGGTSAKMADFGNGLDDAELRGAKLPDFVSRLKGFVNVLGPNPPLGFADKDPFFILRRAILLRSILWRNENQLFENKGDVKYLNIDSGVLRAFLNVRYFKHGIRSMESIVAMSQLSGIRKYGRSSLPAEAQLDLHVDGQEFLALVQQIDLSGELLDRLAARFHQNFCEMLSRQGYQYGKVTDDQTMTHRSLVDYADLSPQEKAQNRDTVQDIYTKLTTAGYMMIPARSNEFPFTFPGTYLEQLAKMEHQRWMTLHFTNGWRLGQSLDNVKKTHPDLVPWEKLTEEAKEKDREFVRAIPRTLAEEGYTLIKLHSVEEK